MRDTQYIKVRATPAAKKESVAKKADVYYISVKERARGGKANARIKAILSQTLHCTPSKLRMIQGATTPTKLYLLHKTTSI